MDEQIFSKGFVTVKMFKPKTLFREGRIINPFLQIDRNKFVNYLIPSPPHDLWQEYNKLRERNKTKAIQSRSSAREKNKEAKILEEEAKLAKLQRQADKEKIAAELKLAKLQQAKLGVSNSRDAKIQEWKKAWPDILERVKSLMRQKPDLGADRCLSRACREHGSDRSAAYYRKEKLLEEAGLI
jgi:hypothetical protein